jgi:hypothetical protein
MQTSHEAGMAQLKTPLSAQRSGRPVESSTAHQHRGTQAVPAHSFLIVLLAFLIVLLAFLIVLLDGNALFTKGR